MKLVSIEIDGFAHFDNSKIELTSEINFIVGPNSSDKTNLLKIIDMVLKEDHAALKKISNSEQGKIVLKFSHTYDDNNDCKDNNFISWVSRDKYILLDRKKFISYHSIYKGIEYYYLEFNAKDNKISKYFNLKNSTEKYSHDEIIDLINDRLSNDEPNKKLYDECKARYHDHLAPVRYVSYGYLTTTNPHLDVESRKKIIDLLRHKDKPIDITTKVSTAGELKLFVNQNSSTSPNEYDKKELVNYCGKFNDLNAEIILKLLNWKENNDGKFKKICRKFENQTNRRMDVDLYDIIIDEKYPPSDGDRSLITTLTTLCDNKYELFLHDQPECNLSIQNKKKLLNLIAENPKCRYILVTHDPEFISPELECDIYHFKIKNGKTQINKLDFEQEDQRKLIIDAPKFLFADMALLVEGYDDVRFYTIVLKFIKKYQHCVVIQMGGKSSPLPDLVDKYLAYKIIYDNDVIYNTIPNSEPKSEKPTEGLTVEKNKSRSSEKKELIKKTIAGFTLEELGINNTTITNSDQIEIMKKSKNKLFILDSDLKDLEGYMRVLGFTDEENLNRRAKKELWNNTRDCDIYSKLKEEIERENPNLKNLIDFLKKDFGEE